ncbi:MAG: glycerol-3-phosphate dehydrogenase [Alphaproteobacteria bacterium]|nr:glycerol-3-phosphate dehydrogenase [Alphaproteobacteria bacterium]
MDGNLYDIAVIGGGVNGCGIARDAAGRGLSVYLGEKSDLAGGTSSASTKLIHGGLRYLEYYAFRLVRESLIEREVLLAMAPHIVRPLRFVLPHQEGLRPVWLIRLGLFLYDHLGGRKLLPASRFVDLRRDPAGEPLKPLFTKGFEYSDCWVDDARLVVLNAIDAAQRGADIRVRTEIVSAAREQDFWKLQTRNSLTGRSATVRSRALVNASGPWISEVIEQRIGGSARSRTRLVKGSHIVVPKLFAHARAYIFQNADRRIIFAIPYERDFTLIGTTDIDYDGDPGSVATSPDEIAYLCGAASEYFAAPIKPDAVVWSYAGVRPLYDDGHRSAQETTRDYLLDLQGQKDEPALLNIFGGKITTYRHLAEEALKKLEDRFPKMGHPWTHDAVLPGGDFDIGGFEALVDELEREYPKIDGALIRRLARSHGTCVRDMLADVKDIGDLGVHFGAGLYQREVEYLIRIEWAMTAEDILWRRSKLGLRLTDTEAAGLGAWIEENYSAVVNSAA